MWGRHDQHDGLPCLANGTRLWDTNEGVLWSAENTMLTPVRGLAASPDGRYVALGGGRRPPLVDLRSASLETSFSEVPTDGLCWSPDGKYLVALAPLGAAVYDGKSGKQLRALSAAPAPPPWPVFSPDGTRLAVWVPNRGPAVHHLTSGKTDDLSKETGDQRPEWMAWSPEGTKLVFVFRGSNDKPWRLVVCDARSGEILHTIKDHKSSAGLWWPNEKSFVVWRIYGGGMAVRDIERGADIVSPGSLGRSVGLCVGSADAKLLAIGCARYRADASRRGAVWLWNSRSGRRTGPLCGHPGPIRGLAFTADGRNLISTCCRLLRVWELKTGRVRQTFVPVGQSEGIFISPEGHYKATEGVAKDIVYVVETEAGQETLTPEAFEAKYGWKNDPAKAVG